MGLEFNICREEYSTGFFVMVVLEVKVIPNSGRSDLEVSESNQIKIYIKSTPEKGKANQELIKLLSKKLDLSPYNFSIISGMTTRNKLVKIATKLTKEEVIERLTNGTI